MWDVGCVVRDMRYGLWGCGLMDVGWEVRGVGMWGVGYESIEAQHYGS